ncbi:hypothetical protein BHE74_00049232 [Ensete ventricosum]|nr:hypothetical protein BHE74_00049232 [Ensete ventricosum]
MKTIRLTAMMLEAVRLAGVESLFSLMVLMVVISESQHEVQVGIEKVKGITFPNILAFVPPVSDDCTVSERQLYRHCLGIRAADGGCTAVAQDLRQ